LNARDPSALKTAAPSVSAFLKGRKEALERYLAEDEVNQIRVSEKTRAFWSEKKDTTEGLLTTLDEADKSDADLSESGKKAHEEYFKKTKAMWEVGLAQVLTQLSKEVVGPFALGAPRHATSSCSSLIRSVLRVGEQISVVDMHLAAWLHELVILSGGNAQESGAVAIARLEGHVGGGFVFAKDAVPAVPASTAVPRATHSEGIVPTPSTTGPKPKLAVVWDALTERPSWQKVFGVKG
jgi:hypothetical protein